MNGLADLALFTGLGAACVLENGVLTATLPRYSFDDAPRVVRSWPVAGGDRREYEISGGLPPAQNWEEHVAFYASHFGPVGLGGSEWSVGLGVIADGRRGYEIRIGGSLQHWVVPSPATPGSDFAGGLHDPLLYGMIESWCLGDMPAEALADWLTDYFA